MPVPASERDIQNGSGRAFVGFPKEYENEGAFWLLQYSDILRKQNPN